MRKKLDSCCRGTVIFILYSLAQAECSAHEASLSLLSVCVSPSAGFSTFRSSPNMSYNWRAIVLLPQDSDNDVAVAKSSPDCSPSSAAPSHSALRPPQRVSQRYPSPSAADTPPDAQSNDFIQVEVVTPSPMPVEQGAATSLPVDQRNLSGLVSDGFSIFEERRKRGYTTAENATCYCDKCGKLFQRRNNLTAHVNTHNSHRSQPFAC